MAESERQECLDRFYWKHGPCCAGCDWWRSISQHTGRCTRAAPVSALEVMRSLGITSSSYPFAPGQPYTEREHVCGEFKDEFDWTSLPLPYRVRVGAPTGRQKRQP